MKRTRGVPHPRPLPVRGAGSWEPLADASALRRWSLVVVVGGDPAPGREHNSRWETRLLSSRSIRDCLNKCIRSWLQSVMFIAACRIELELPESSSLKDKRQVLRSLMARVRNKFNAAVAEVDYQESWRDAALGIVCVSNSALHARSMAEAVAAYVDESRMDAITGSVAIDVSEVLE